MTVPTGALPRCARTGGLGPAGLTARGSRGQDHDVDGLLPAPHHHTVRAATGVLLLDERIQGRREDDLAR